MTSDEPLTRKAALRSRPAQPSSSDPAFDYEKAEAGIRLLLEAVGENPDRDGLTETWARRVPETWKTLTEGLRPGSRPELRTFDADVDDLVIKTGIPLYSVCEHHLLPYSGTAHVAYRPNGRVVGLSKLVRYVRWQSRRLTIQEQLTHDIAEGLADELNSESVLVRIIATHLCEAMRGVETDTESRTLATAGSPTEAERRRFQTVLPGGSP